MTRRSILALLLTAAVGLSGALATNAAHAQQTPPAKKLTANDLAKKMQEFYKNTRDFKAKFKQVYSDVAAGDTKESYGRVYFKRKGKMRWDYYEASKKTKKQELKKLLISDGNVFWVYEPQFKQVFKECLQNSKLPTSLRFLMGQGDLLKDFDAKLSKKSTDAKPVLTLTPKKPTSKYKQLEFVIHAETFQVLRTTIYDPYGNTNEITFAEMALNKNLPDKGFSFKPPKGARLLNPQKKCAPATP